MCAASNTASSAAFFLLVLLLAQARRRLRERHGIPPRCCGDGCDDLCAAFCCFPLVQSQMLRHLGMAEGTRYSATSPIGVATRV